MHILAMCVFAYLKDTLVILDSSQLLQNCFRPSLDVIKWVLIESIFQDLQLETRSIQKEYTLIRSSKIKY
jgi:hypothetical protein